jgi:hypothetical protein
MNDKADSMYDNVGQSLPFLGIAKVILVILKKKIQGSYFGHFSKRKMHCLKKRHFVYGHKGHYSIKVKICLYTGRTPTVFGR